MYDPNDNLSDFDSEHVDGEYPFDYSDETDAPGVRQSGVYADADYIPLSEAPQVVPRYNSYSAVPEPSKRDGRQRQKTGNVSFARIAALCLVCAMLGGTMGFGGAVLWGNVGMGDGSPSVVLPTEATEKPAKENGAATIVNTPVASTTGEVVALSGDQIYEIACPQTVGITTEITTTNIFGQTSNAVSGSGFIISSDGYILTNYHVVEDARQGGYEISVMLFNGESYPAEIVGVEKDGTDLAVLKIDVTGLSAVTVGDSDSMRVGETVYALGNPLGELTYTLTSGMVSALDRVIATGSSEADSINMFQVDVAINNGNSGGPILNSRGEVVGIATAKYSSVGVEGIGFAIPISDAIRIAEELIEKGYVGGKAKFGINVETVSAYAAQYYNLVEGACVFEITAGECGDIAGIKVGDIITSVDDISIKGRPDLIVAKRSYRAGDTATLTVYRDGGYIELSITFDEEIPNTSADAQTQQGQTTSDPRDERTNPFFR